MDAINPAVPAQGQQAPARAGQDHGSASLHRAAVQFEAVFMTEMLRQARPPAKATGVFASGSGEKSWQVFMDQALGEAAAAHDGSGLGKQIEAALRAAQGKGSHQ